MSEFITDRAEAHFHKKLAESNHWDAEGAVIEWENAAANLCGSPIEQEMLSALIWADFGFGPGRLFVWDHTMAERHPLDLEYVTLAPQYPEGRYNIDVALFVPCPTGGHLQFAIECDGHDFHEKTKEQARHDKARDRRLIAKGWIPFRFTGSEIWADADGCAEEVAVFVRDWFSAQLEKLSHRH